MVPIVVTEVPVWVVVPFVAMFKLAALSNGILYAHERLSVADIHQLHVVHLAPAGLAEPRLKLTRDHTIVKVDCVSTRPIRSVVPAFVNFVMID